MKWFGLKARATRHRVGPTSIAMGRKIFWSDNSAKERFESTKIWVMANLPKGNGSKQEEMSRKFRVCGDARVQLHSLWTWMAMGRATFSPVRILERVNSQWLACF